MTLMLTILNFAIISVNHIRLRNSGIFQHIYVLESNIVIRRDCSILFFLDMLVFVLWGVFQMNDEWWMMNDGVLWEFETGCQKKSSFIHKGPRVLWFIVMYWHFRKLFNSFQQTKIYCTLPGTRDILGTFQNVQVENRD